MRYRVYAGTTIGLKLFPNRATTQRERLIRLEQLRSTKLLDHLKEVSPKLHLCCLMTYGCWLRPHVEIRMLTKGQFRNNFSEIHLSGKENKGGRVRVVYVPDYVREALLLFLEGITDEDNVFSGCMLVYAPGYFSTVWEREKEDMVAAKLITKTQTIYSFRHTAAVNVYRKTKDVYVVQKMLGHGSVMLTLKYLRGLGEVNIEEMRDSAPEL